MMAVLLVALGCSSGDDDFTPAPGATIPVDDLEAVVRDAISDFDLQWVESWTLPEAKDVAPHPNCNEAASSSGACGVAGPPGIVVALRTGDTTDIRVKVQLGIDELEAGDRVQSSVTSRGHMESRLLRLLNEPPVSVTPMTSGPCDRDAERTADEGCAWQERNAPGVGDDAAAMKSDSLTDGGMSAVVFARGHVSADIEVRRAGSGTPDGLANDLAKALDAQIMRRLAE